jgi:8-oxo-dGTP pyrophosphatase MutT (NUDIX family)
MSRPVTEADLPDWWHPLAERASGIEGHEITRFLPPETGAKPSAVLILLGEGGDGPDVLLMQRAATLRHHAGQPSFPGGVTEPEDTDPVATALREANEEVGLDPDSVTVVTSLPELWINVTNYRVTPVLAWWHASHPILAIDPAEVAMVARIPLRELADPANRVRARHPSGYIGPAFDMDGLLVWGFTAGVLATVLRLGGWERPWEPGRVVDLE